jgi:predicted nucleic acid-binding protein
MSELTDIRRDLEEIEAMRKAIDSFGTRYRRYAQVATRRRARTVRQAQTDFDNASRDVNAAQTDLAEAGITALQRERRESEARRREEIALIRKRLREVESAAQARTADTFTHVLSDTLQLSRRYRLSSYDASYLELALRNGAPIATLDDDLRRAANKAGVKTFKPT